MAFDSSVKYLRLVHVNKRICDAMRQRLGLTCQVSCVSASQDIEAHWNELGNLLNKTHVH